MCEDQIPCGQCTDLGGGGESNNVQGRCVPYHTHEYTHTHACIPQTHLHTHTGHMHTHTSTHTQHTHTQTHTHTHTMKVVSGDFITSGHASHLSLTDEGIS